MAKRLLVDDFVDPLGWLTETGACIDDIVDGARLVDDGLSIKLSCEDKKVTTTCGSIFARWLINGARQPYRRVLRNGTEESHRGLGRTVAKLAKQIDVHPNQTTLSKSCHTTLKALDDIGISKDQSSKWRQKINVA